MAEGYNLRSTEDVVSGLFSEQQEEAEDAPSDSETKPFILNEESVDTEDDFIFQSLAVAVYSDEGEDKDNIVIDGTPAKKMRLSKMPSQSQSRSGRTYVKNEPSDSLEAPEKIATSPSSVANESPGPTGAAREAKTPLQAWSLLFNDDLLNKIVLHTNQEIERSRVSGEATVTQNNDTTRAELNGLLGLLYFSGLQKNNSANLDELWSTPFGSSLYRATMPCKRFKFLLSNLRFDDKLTRNERRNEDKFAPLREIWQMFVASCEKYYRPHGYCTVDEQLLAFRGTCPFRIYMPGKTDGYGIKFIMLNDEETFYMINAEPYVEKVSPNSSESLPEYRVRTITRSIHRTDRTVTCNKSLATVELIQRMKHEFSLNVVAGTGRKNTECFDQLCHEYSTARKTQRWPMRVFYGMLDQGGINAYILYSYNNVPTSGTTNRTSFLKTLIMSLLESQLKMRVTLPQLRRELRTSIRKILNMEIPQHKPNPSQAKRCFECPRERDRKTKVYCSTCKRPVCDDHRIQLCLDCAAHD